MSTDGLNVKLFDQINLPVQSVDFHLHATDASKKTICSVFQSALTYTRILLQTVQKQPRRLLRQGDNRQVSSSTFFSFPSFLSTLIRHQADELTLATATSLAP